MFGNSELKVRALTEQAGSSSMLCPVTSTAAASSARDLKTSMASYQMWLRSNEKNEKWCKVLAVWRQTL